MTTATHAANGERRDIPARLSALPETADFAQRFCEQRAIARPVALRLTLAIEELVTNTVTHGHGGASEARIVIGLSLAAGSVRLAYADAAPRFDPRPWFASAPASLDAPAAERAAGGLGLHLVGRYASRVRYAYRGGNRIVLAIPIDGERSRA